MISLPDLAMGPSGPLMGKANHLEPIHTGGTTHITTRRKPAKTTDRTLDHQWLQNWRNNGRTPGANWPHTRIFSWPLALDYRHTAGTVRAPGHRVRHAG